MCNYVLNANTKPKFHLFEKVNVIFTGAVEGVRVSVKKELIIMGVRYCLNHGIKVEGSKNYEAVGSFYYELAESLDSKTITKVESEIQNKVIKKRKKAQDSK